MKLKEFFEMLDKAPRNDYIVRLGYKYKWEHDYTYENQYLEYDGNDDCYVWLHDWDEGQEDVIVLGYICIDDVFCVPLDNDKMKKILNALHGCMVYGAMSQDEKKEEQTNAK